MMVIFLLLPAVALASIAVKFSGKIHYFDTIYNGVISSKGFEKRYLTDHDRDAFQIQDEALKSAIERLYGNKPDQIYLTPNTEPWGNLYRSLALDPIEVKIEAVTPINMVAISSETVHLTRSVYENKYTKPKKYNIHKCKPTYDTVTSQWSNPRNIAANAVDIELNFEVDKEVVSLKNTVSFGLNYKTIAKKVRRISGSIDLAAGQKVLAQIEVKKGTLKFQIPYKMSLNGSIALIYNEEYKKSHFHGLDINLLLGKRTLTVLQTLSYEFYYGHKLIIADVNLDGQGVSKEY